jgi:hypothetical protein
VQRHHTLRMIAFPIFLILLTIPALLWLIENERTRSEIKRRVLRLDLRTSTFRLQFSMFTPTWLRTQLERRRIRQIILFSLLGLMLIQGVLFQAQFRREGLNRGHVFDAAYPEILAEALANQKRPIYLEDGYWGPAYIHAYWYATIQHVDTAQFVHLSPGARAPAGSLVISSEINCGDCEIVSRRGSYILYRKF